MSKGLYLKIGGALVTTSSGIALAVLPNIIPSNWNIPIFAIAIAGIVAGLIIIRLGVKIDKTEAINTLQAIKNDIIALDKCEKEVARKKDISGISKDKRDKVKSDIKDYLTNTGVALLTSALSASNGEQVLDNVIKFFVSIGDIFDSNDFGLKEELADVEEYNNAKENIAKKQLRLGKKKRVLMQNNIHKATILIYGLNSVIVFRKLYRSFPDFQKSIPVKYNMMVEGVEREGEKFLNQMLENLDKGWGKIIKIDFNEV